MHHNYFILKQLAQYLGGALQGMHLVTAFSNTPDDIYFEFASETKAPFYLQLKSVNRELLFMFPETALGKSRLFMPQFRAIHGQRVTAVTAVAYDRYLLIHFEGEAILVFKLFGRFSNIVLLENGIAGDMFYRHLEADQQITADDIAGKKTFNYEVHACSDPQQFKQTYPFIPSEIKKAIEDSGFFSLPEIEKAAAFNVWKSALEQPARYYVAETTDNVLLSIIDSGAGKPFDRVEDAVQAFTSASLRFHAFHNLKAMLERQYAATIKKKLNYINSSESSLKDIGSRIPYEHLANIIMAGLHLVPEGAHQAEFLNVYTNEPITLKLNPDITPQKQAEQYYRKAKREHIEKELLESRISAAKAELETLNNALKQIQQATSLKDLRPFEKQQTRKNAEPERPFRMLEMGGYDIMIGKHAKGNDAMLRNHTHKNDIWLHAKDVSGSHIIIKNPSGKTVPITLLEKVAAVAAYHSKARNHTVAPVIYTERKYVRKVKGAAPGEVLVEKEKVLLVAPANIS